MSNLFDDFSPEIVAGWFARVSSSERWEMEKEEFWQCCASDQSGCKGCNWFEDDNCEASFNDECPQVIAEFNLDDRHFN